MIFSAIAEGRLHLSAVVLLFPHLTSENATGLLASAEYKTRCELEAVLAARFPRSEMLPLIEALPTDARQEHSVSPGTPNSTTSGAPNRVGRSEAPDRCRIQPQAAQRFALHLTMGQRMHDKLRHAQELLSHAVPSGDAAEVLERALDALIRQIEKRRFGGTEKPRPPKASKNPRSIPAHVRKAVWERDGGRCTFVSETGHRCESRRHLQYDHVEPVARGGQATVSGIRLLCRAHNQHEAERLFGVRFMAEKRETARRLAASSRRSGEAAAQT